MRRDIVVLGVFVADCAFRTNRAPRVGETVLGQGFTLGPGGKGSNQAVAAGKAGGRAHIVTRLGDDTFAQLAYQTWNQAGVTPSVSVDPDAYTGAAGITVDTATGDNAIIVAPGAAGALGAQDLDARSDLIEGAAVFMTQLEQPLEAAQRGLQLARAGGARTILNPAPAADLPEDLLTLCDIVTPNETETEALTGLTVDTPEDAEAAAAALRTRGVGAVVVTMGAQGVLYQDATRTLRIPALQGVQAVDTTGAGDAFNGAFATALAEGQEIEDALRFGCAAAGLSVQKIGAAASMPTREEIERALDS